MVPGISEFSENCPKVADAIPEESRIPIRHNPKNKFFIGIASKIFAYIQID